MGTWDPITKQRFLELARARGANEYLASDLWYFRPVDHLHDTEDQVLGNLELLIKTDPAWLERNNQQARAVDRHRYRPDDRGKCDYCRAPKRSAAHNLEPLNAIGPGQPKGLEP